MQKLHIEKIIIPKQFEKSENYKKFLKIIKNKTTKIHIVETGQKINIEKDLYFDILWPNSETIINENAINNNSLVCKMVYKNFSCIFTGDIEKVAEEAILQQYENSNKLKATILKVAHHGSKSSSSEKFVNIVKPEIALIGVGKNNTFGHPNEGVLKRIEKEGIKIYRTDLNGEITIRVNKKEKMWINKMLK